MWDMKGNKKGSYKFGSCKRKLRENGMLKDGRRQPRDGNAQKAEVLFTTLSVFQDKAPFLNLSVAPRFGREKSSQQWWRRSMGDYFCVWLGILKLMGLQGIHSRLLREQPSVTARLLCTICEELWWGRFLFTEEKKKNKG